MYVHSPHCPPYVVSLVDQTKCPVTHVNHSLYSKPNNHPPTKKRRFLHPIHVVIAQQVRAAQIMQHLSRQIDKLHYQVDSKIFTQIVQTATHKLMGFPNHHTVICELYEKRFIRDQRCLPLRLVEPCNIITKRTPTPIIHVAPDANLHRHKDITHTHTNQS